MSKNALDLDSGTLSITDNSPEENLHRRLILRLLPLLLVCYLFAHLDRINIGFAKLQMSSDLGFSNTVYGFGAGLFFVSYMLFGVPSNIVLDRVGPRRWIAFLMVSWGLMSTAMLLVQTPFQFYALRFLLGVAEAGFFPGILVYLNRWFPADRRAQVTAMFAIAVPMAGIIGGPVSGWILENMLHVANMRGWQWMFLLEGAPVVVLGLVVLRCLPDSFEHVKWLTDAEKNLMRLAVEREEKSKQITSFTAILRNGYVWMLVAIYSAVMLGMGIIAFWMPTLIATSGIQHDSTIGLLSAIPYLFGCASMIVVGRSSDKRKERRWHLCGPLLMAAGGISMAGLFSHDIYILMPSLIVACMGVTTALPMFWQLPPAFLSDRILATGIALVSSLGSVASFLSPYFVGWMRDATQSTSLALYLLASLIALGGLLVLRIPAVTVNPE
ncbi:MFS transporter [Pseudomonas fluorescens]|uniref:MFS transporter n=1 Tax=Pseudomonas fluorescens TaxID=294 RepID=UPI002ACA011F|nr:MFS transporter [Pseudomonas fluorescens]MDZ5431366.1 MFS transporter [Pseudomonas fluorescens]